MLVAWKSGAGGSVIRLFAGDTSVPFRIARDLAEQAPVAEALEVEVRHAALPGPVSRDDVEEARARGHRAARCRGPRDEFDPARRQKREATGRLAEAEAEPSGVAVRARLEQVEEPGGVFVEEKLPEARLGGPVERVSLDAAARTGDLVLPALPYGCSLGHTDHWPGTLSLGPIAMTTLLIEVGQWVHASGFRKLVIVNGHATNGPPCQSAILQLRHELPDLRPRFVSSGVVGAPTTATPERGAELFAMLVDALAELLTAARSERDPDLGS
jgi:Creatinine amidohydrolase